jgi:hypothetical protein
MADSNSEPRDDEWKGWPQAKAAAEELEITQKALLQFVHQNRIDRWRAPDGSWRFSPSEIERLRDRIAQGEEQGANGLPRASFEDVLAANVALLKQAHEHIQMLMSKGVEKPLGKAIELITTHTEQMQAELKETRGQTLALFRAQQDLLNESEVRQQLKRETDAKLDRQKQVWGMAVQHAPKLFDQLLLTLQSKSPEAEAAVQLIKGLDPMFLQAFLESDMLTPEQRALLKKIVDSRKKADAKAAPSAPAEQKPEEKQAAPNGSAPAEQKPEPSPAPAEAPPT